MSFILLKEVLNEIDRTDEQGHPVSFNMKFVTADRKRRTGGEIIEANNVHKCITIRNNKVVYDSRPHVSRNPHHFTNATRNIIFPNGQIRKVHIRLIIEFNNQRVLW